MFRRILVFVVVFLLFGGGLVFGFVDGVSGQKTQTWDFGDASDPSFPSELSSNGVRHINISRAYFGTNVSEEKDSKQVDNDTFDDGLITIDPINVSVTNKDWMGDLYLNVLVDWDGNGMWEPYNRTVGQGAIITRTFPSDWVVRNKKVSVSPGITETIATNVSAMGAGIGAGTSANIRLTLTSNPINNYSGRGEFDIGETEDYFRQILGKWVSINCKPVVDSHTAPGVSFPLTVTGTDLPASVNIDPFGPNAGNAGFGLGGNLILGKVWPTHPSWGITIHNVRVLATGSSGTTSASTCQAFIKHFPVFIDGFPIIELEKNPQTIIGNVSTLQNQTKMISSDLDKIGDRIQRKQNNPTETIDTELVNLQLTGILDRLNNTKKEKNDIQNDTQKLQNIKSKIPTKINKLQIRINKNESLRQKLESQIQSNNINDTFLQILRNKDEKRLKEEKQKLQKKKQQFRNLEDNLTDNQESQDLKRKINNTINNIENKINNLNIWLSNLNSQNNQTIAQQIKFDIHRQIKHLENNTKALRSLNNTLKNHTDKINSKTQKIDSQINQIETKINSIRSQISPSPIDLYDKDNQDGIEGLEVRQAIKCFLFGDNCINNNRLNGNQVRSIIKAFLGFT